MYNWIDITNFTVAISGLLLAILGLVLNLNTPFSERWNHRFYIVFFMILIAYIASDIIEQISFYFLGKDFWILTKTGIFFESLFSSLLMPLLTIQILHYAGSPLKKSLLFRIETLLWAIYLVMLVITQFTEKIYYVSEENMYSRGPLYFLLLIPPALMTFFNTGYIIYRHDRFSKSQIKAFLLFLLIPFACILIQMFSYGLLMIVIGTSVSALFMFGYLMTEVAAEQIRQKEENAKLKTETAVLQMRPHFIYNTMTSIYYLCEQDPKKAQKVTLDFTTYLRKNFNAIARQDMIPFDEELVHTKAYLAVEQVRFEDTLIVEFNTPHTEFCLPPLTLQPIVENAVKYGVDPEESVPLNITITTQKTDDGSIIIIEDTGPGIDDAGNNDQPHTAIINIRKRLELMCRGTLTIKNRENGNGTIATIFIPEK